MLAYRKIMRLGIFTALPTLLTAGLASVALATIAPGTFTATINPAEAPSGTHAGTGTPTCTVGSQADGFPVSCSRYSLGGVGHTNATVDLVANYSATINCTNKGGNLVESHTTTQNSTSGPVNLAPSRNGQLVVVALSVSGFTIPESCPNPNWTPSIAEGTLTLNSFSYTLTFVGFDSPYITIAATDP
jgi:hypothetical protein